jgi:Holliday junction resolvase RusA-like endonuclease
MIDSPLVIWLPLLPPSINHLYRPGPRRGQRVLSDEARAFRAYVVSEVALQARHEGWSVPDGDLWITIRLTFGSRARMDIDNRVKAALDAVALALAFDDCRVARLVVERVGIDPKRPACEITIQARHLEES